MATAPPEISGFDINTFYSQEPPAETEKYIFQQTMIRVRNPKASLDFYCNVLGFDLIWHSDYPEWGFSVYFLTPKGQLYQASETRQKLKSNTLTSDEKFELCMRTPGCVELTWNHGSESEKERVYNVGNADTTGVPNGEKVKGGFGHLGVTVPDVYEACERFKSLGVELKKSPNSGGMKGLAFILDPDGYSIEILPQGAFVTKDVDCNGVALEGGEGYKDNSK